MYTPRLIFDNETPSQKSQSDQESLTSTSGGPDVNELNGKKAGTSGASTSSTATGTPMLEASPAPALSSSTVNANTPATTSSLSLTIPTPSYGYSQSSAETLSPSRPQSRTPSHAQSRSQSRSGSRAHTPTPTLSFISNQNHSSAVSPSIDPDIDADTVRLPVASRSNINAANPSTTTSASATTVSSPAPVSEYVLAMHDYEPQHSNTTCLSFRAGQVIHVINRDASGWWDGELEGRRGWFPSNYVNADLEARSESAGLSRTGDQPQQSQRIRHQYSPSSTSSISTSSSFARRQRGGHTRHPSISEALGTDIDTYCPPVMVPLLHGLSLLQNAVRANRITHFQPSTACIISCVRSILESTSTLSRDASILQQHPALAQERRKILTVLASLVAQAKKASEEGLGDDKREEEVQGMLKLGGQMFAHVRRFLAVAVQCGVDLPQGKDNGTLNAGLGMAGSPVEEESTDTEEEDDLGGRALNGGTPTQKKHWETLATTNGRSQPQSQLRSTIRSPASTRARSMFDLRSDAKVGPVPLTKTVSAKTVPGQTDGQNQLLAQRQGQGQTQVHFVRERVFTRHKPGLSISSTSSSSSYSSQEIPLCSNPPPFPSGPTNSIRVLDALRYTHDQYLSTIAAFIGHAHSYSRFSHASSTGHLYELTHEIVQMVSKILTIVVAVMRHPDMPTHRVNHLKTVYEGLYRVTSVLAEAVRMLTMPLKPGVSEEEEKAALIRSATGALKAGADCVAAVKVCLNRGRTGLVSGDKPFIVNLPYVRGEETQMRVPVKGLPRSTSMSALNGPGVEGQEGEGKGEEEGMTIRKRIVGMPLSYTGEAYPGSEATGSTSGHRRPNPLSLVSSPVESDLPSPSSFARTDDDGTTWEGSTRAHGVSPLEDKMANDDLQTEPLSFNHDPSNWMSSHDYSLEDVAYNSEGHLVGATLEVLVEKMTPHDNIVDSAFSAVFFMTFRLFSSPVTLVDALITRYNLVPPRGISYEELQLWQQKKGLPVRLRVSNFIKLWVEHYWRPGVDDPALNTLVNFTRDALGNYFPGPAQRILELLNLRKQTTELTISPKGDRARDPGYSLNPPLLGMTSSEIPRPMMTKTLLVALRKKEYAGIVVTDFDSLELARQMSIMECNLYCAIMPDEILEVGQDGIKPAVNVKAVTTLSTVITGWVAENILNEQDLKKRTMLIKFFIKVADRCTLLNNFSTSRSILAALDSSTIARLRQTWAGVPQKSKNQLEALRKLADHGRNYHEYRNKLRNTAPPAVPFLGLYLTDITFCREGNPSHRASPLNAGKKLLNFNKYHKLARIVQDMQRFQVPYNLKAIPEVQEYLNVAFENVKHNGDFQDLYRRSLLVEPKQPADMPPTDNMRQLFNWATRSQPTTTPL